MPYSIQNFKMDTTFNGFRISDSAKELLTPIEVPMRGQEYASKSPHQLRDMDMGTNHTGITPRLQTVWYSGAINDLYAEYQRDPDKCIRNYRWNLSLMEWVHKTGLLSYMVKVAKHNVSPQIVSLHERFLSDASRYISVGNMGVNLFSWKRMITAARTDGYNPPTKKDCMEYLGVTDDETIDILARWAQADGGMKHMLETMYLVYGKPSE